MSAVALVYSRLTKRSAIEWISAITSPMALGVISALACVAVRLFFRLLQWGFVQHMSSLPSAAEALSPGRRLATPIIGAAMATLVIWLSERFSPGLHFEEYVEAVRLRGGRIPFLSTAWRTLSSAFSVASGAAIGREGSMIQFATAVTSWAGARTQARMFSLSQRVAFGAAAAVAAAYQAPIAGVFFASEIVLGEWTWGNTLPLFLSSTSGWLVSRMILGGGPLFPVAGTFHLTFSLLWSIPLALLLGIVGPAYQKLLHFAREAKRLPLPLLWGASTVAILSLFEPRVWGNGDIALTSILQPGTIWTATLGLLVFRLVATTLCVGTGTVGGVFTPTLFAGAALGLLSAHASHSHASIFLAVCGTAFLLAAVTHAPIMAAFMAVELSGQWDILPVLLPCAWLASNIARRISSSSLYGIASPEPQSEHQFPDRSLKLRLRAKTGITATMIENFRIRVFRAVAHHLNFSRAAEELLLTQPAVTQQIKALEDEFGVPLFERGGGHIALSAGGKALLPFADKMKDLSDEAAEAVANAFGHQAGELALGASQTISQYLLPNFIAGFRRANPKVKITARSGNSDEMLEALLAREIDMALIEGPEQRKDVHIEPFMEDHSVTSVSAHS